jgi:parvulin-like peptidyl-prolyl isomerase
MKINKRSLLGGIAVAAFIGCIAAMTPAAQAVAAPTTVGVAMPGAAPIRTLALDDEDDATQQLLQSEQEMQQANEQAEEQNELATQEAQQAEQQGVMVEQQADGSFGFGQ